MSFDKPRDCRLSDREWVEYVAACQPGRLFFYEGDGWASDINHRFQNKILNAPVLNGPRPTHVGVIDRERLSVEATLAKGLTRNLSVDRLTVGKGKLYIGELKPEPDAEDIQRGLDNLSRYIRKNPHGYDWLSLVTFGKWQTNGDTICSECVKIYVDGVFRYRRAYVLTFDELVLPYQFLDYVKIHFEG